VGSHANHGTAARPPGTANPDPYGEEDDRCCNACNYTKVIPARLAGFANELDRRNN